MIGLDQLRNSSYTWTVPIENLSINHLKNISDFLQPPNPDNSPSMNLLPPHKQYAKLLLTHYNPFPTLNTIQAKHPFPPL